jgi:1-acyl-sn-glycerol-3-phosphate acyltransferase
MPRLRALAILAAFLILTVAGIPVQVLSLRLRLRLRKTYPHRYHQLLARLFGVRITVLGKPIQDRGVLMVANHTSYFDILVLSASACVSFVAKKEVNDWPFFGLMSRLQESVFVERDKRSQAMASRDLIRDRLKSGDALVLFPEGTSTDGNHVRPFKSALMGAVETEIGSDAEGRVRYVPVQPVSIAYVGMNGMPMGREFRPLFAWYGDMDMIPHLWEALKAGPFDVTVEFHPPITVDSAGGRKQIAVLAESMVRRGQMRALHGLASRLNRGAALSEGGDALAEAAA